MNSEQRKAFIAQIEQEKAGKKSPDEPPQPSQHAPTSPPTPLTENESAASQSAQFVTIREFQQLKDELKSELENERIESEAVKDVQQAQINELLYEVTQAKEKISPHEQNQERLRADTKESIHIVVEQVSKLSKQVSRRTLPSAPPKVVTAPKPKPVAPPTPFLPSQPKPETLPANWEELRARARAQEIRRIEAENPDREIIQYPSPPGRNFYVTAPKPKMQESSGMETIEMLFKIAVAFLIVIAAISFIGAIIYGVIWLATTIKLWIGDNPLISSVLLLMFAFTRLITVMSQSIGEAFVKLMIGLMMIVLATVGLIKIRDYIREQREPAGFYELE